MQGGNQRYPDHCLYPGEVGHHHPQGRRTHLYPAGAAGHPGERRQCPQSPGVEEGGNDGRWVFRVVVPERALVVEDVSGAWLRRDWAFELWDECARISGSAKKPKQNRVNRANLEWE